MPKILRPRQEFPTPAFRAFVGVLAGGLGGVPVWILAAGLDNPGPALGIMGFAAFVVAALVATLGESARRLAVGFVVGVIALLAGFGVVALVAVAIGNFE